MKLAHISFLLSRHGARAGLLALTTLVAACGGGGGGGGSGGSAGATPSQPGGTVPDSAMTSTSGLMRFMTAWAADDTVEPLALGAQAPAADDGDAWPVD